ncbi:hypothetical protein BDZ45DRAFT_666663 [Acephala macrosclerotiorum]|nr:hypothetical protein BDZ45DRAFT_666663 [Acephala macrosclerotiorum]
MDSINSKWLFKMAPSALEHHPLSLLPTSFRPQNPQDWEPYKEAVTRLYSDMKLSAVIEVMEEKYNFRATPNQYKKQLSKWGIAKRVKGIEYDAIARKTNERASEGKRSEILLRGEEVSIENIKRYERNKAKREMVREDYILRDAATPPSLILRTPPPEERVIFGPLDTDMTDPSDQLRDQGLDTGVVPRREVQGGPVGWYRGAGNVASPLSSHGTVLQRCAGPIFNIPRLCRSPSPSDEPWFRAFRQFYELGYGSGQSEISATLFHLPSGSLHACFALTKTRSNFS